MLTVPQKYENMDNKYKKNKFKDTLWIIIRTETTMSATATDDIINNSINNDKPVESTRLTGCVKWFNNKTGFGFITALGDSEGVKDGSDVFVHHSTVKVAQEQYRYLVQGEYVEFVLSKTADSSKHEFQAADVSGVKGGKLICETRWESRASGASGAGGESRFSRSADGVSEWKTVRNTSAFAPRQSGAEWRRGDSGTGRGSGRGRGVSTE
jgi:cold shock CspA family protein